MSAGSITFKGVHEYLHGGASAHFNNKHNISCFSVHFLSSASALLVFRFCCPPFYLLFENTEYFQIVNTLYTKTFWNYVFWRSCEFLIRSVFSATFLVLSLFFDCLSAVIWHFVFIIYHRNYECMFLILLFLIRLRKPLGTYFIVRFDLSVGFSVYIL